MDDLSTLLRTASDGAPPTAIDLDHLIATDRRRRRTRWLVTSSALGVLVVAGLSLTLTHRAPGWSAPLAGPAPVASEPSPTTCENAELPPSTTDRTFTPRNGPPTEDPEAANQRLSAALLKLLPEGARASAGSECAGTVVFREPKAGDYRAVTWIGAGRDEYSLAFMINPMEAGATPQCRNNDHSSCTRIDLPGGGVAMADLVTADDFKAQRSVIVYHQDGTVVLMTAIGPQRALPSPAQLATIGSAPQLTLYP